MQVDLIAVQENFIVMQGAEKNTSGKGLFEKEIKITYSSSHKICTDGLCTAFDTANE